MTNIVEFSARDSIQQQARKWLIRMDGDEPLSEAERAALSDWMALSALHRAELIRLSKFWREANVLTRLVADVRVRPRRRVRWLAVARVAIVVATLIISVGWHLLAGEGFSGIYKIAKSQVVTILAGSSSPVWPKRQ